MTLKQYDVARLLRTLPEHGPAEGAVGTIVTVYEAPGAFEVEFADQDGVTIALVALSEEDIERTQAR